MTAPNAVSAAARVTLASGSARVWHRTWLDPPQRRLFGERLLARHPWLDEEDDAQEDDEPAAVFAGTAQFFGSGSRWTVLSEGSATRRDPIWIVEMLNNAAEALPRGEDAVRGTECRRWEFRVDPRGRPRALGRRRERLQIWQTTELWDFGIPVEINVPTVEREPSEFLPVGLAKFAWKLWRRKRAYARR